MTTVDQIANAVLYEGYILYPYRPSSVKNRQRWNFGLVYPRNYPGPGTMQTECLVRGDASTTLTARVRFLQIVMREVGESDAPAEGFAQEAIEREIALPGFRLPDPAFQQTFHFAPLDGMIEVAATEAGAGVYRITLHISNLTELAEPDRTGHETVVLQSMVSTHTILEVADGDFVSLLDPPGDLRLAAAACQNIGTWPVLAGEGGQYKSMLSSPIILYDYPEVAPESPGDLFDGTEIDEILTLRIMTMTDQEKEEMRGSDERARRILERTETLPPEHLAKLHGALRGLYPVADR
jgi:hypothetical protein